MNFATLPIQEDDGSSRPLLYVYFPYFFGCFVCMKHQRGMCYVYVWAWANCCLSLNRRHCEGLTRGISEDRFPRLFSCLYLVMI